MIREPAIHDLKTDARGVLQAYFLGNTEYDAALAFQRRLVYQISGDRTSAALILCEHPPLITVGRQGSWSHIQGQAEELMPERWQVRWVNRGGGCFLHLPGQMAIYPMLALDERGLSIRQFIGGLQQAIIALLDDFSIRGTTREEAPGVWVGGRPIAKIGIAVRDWVTYYGAFLNVNPDLDLCRDVQLTGPAGGKMTSIERERHGPLRASLVRERFLEHFTSVFPFERTSLFLDHPTLSRKVAANALTPSA